MNETLNKPKLGVRFVPEITLGNVLQLLTIGAAVVVLPKLIVGNELLILGGAAIATSGWFLAHWHGRLQGFVDMDGVA